MSKPYSKSVAWYTFILIGMGLFAVCTGARPVDPFVAALMVIYFVDRRLDEQK
jgi:hypothetical protein